MESLIHTLNSYGISEFHLIVGIVLSIVLIVVTSRLFKSKAPTQTAPQPVTQREPPSTQVTKPSEAPKNRVLQADHSLVYRRLKGFRGPTVAVFSPDEKSRWLAVIAADDRSPKVYYVNSLASKDHRFIQLNLQADTPTWCSFDKTGNYLIFSLADTNTIVAYQLFDHKNKEGRHYSLKAEFPEAHKSSIKNLVLAPNSQFIASCGEDTEIKIWNLKGNVIAHLDTKQMKNNCVAISPNSRWIACGAFTGDVKIWEAEYDKKTKAFVGIKTPHILQLKGHTVRLQAKSNASVCFSKLDCVVPNQSGVRGLSFTSDGMRVATASLDGTWRLWNLDVKFVGQQDPACLVTVTSTDKSPYHGIAISPDDKTVATFTNNKLEFWTIDGKPILSIPNAHSKAITSLSWSSDSSLLVTASLDCTCVIWKRPESESK